VKVDLPPSVRPIAGLRGLGYAPRIIDATAMNEALAATEPQGVFRPRVSLPADGLSDGDAMEQMRRLLCSGSTTEDARPTGEGEAEAARAQGELDPVAEEQEPRAYTKTSPQSKRSTPEILDPKLEVSGATTARPRARRTVVALLTCAAAAMVGAGVGLFGQKDGRIEATEVAPVGAAFAMEATEATSSAGAAANGETKPAGLEVPKSAGVQAADTGSEAARGSPGATAQREVEPQKDEAQGGETKTQPKGIKPAATAPKKGPATSRKKAGDDFNFGF
jgi:hypothetical protein